MRTLNFAFWTIALALLAGCASPRYQTVYRYEAPTDTVGRACLEQCEPKLAVCQASCQHTYQACLKRIEPLADARYAEALKHYQAEWAEYRRELDRYQFQSALGWNYPAAPWYGPWPYYYPYYNPWPAPYVFPPTPPAKPSRAEAFKQLRQAQCEGDCGCQPIYDACFLTCGGKKIPEVQCIAHCPKGK